MKRMWKRRALSILLVLSLIFASASIAYAEDSPGPEEDADEVVFVEEPDADDPADDPGDPEDIDGIEEGAEEAPDLFPGMPDGYELSSEERARKAEIKSEGIVVELGFLVAGEDYVEGEVIILTDSLDFAETVADAYGGDVANFGEGLALVELSEETTTSDALEAAADANNNMPAVYPNFIYRLPEVFETDKEPAPDDELRAMVGEAAPTKGFWNDSYLTADPFLRNINSGVGNYKTARDGSVSGYQWHHDVIGTYSAWQTTKGAGVKVAVLDTGVLSTHQDLPGRVDTASGGNFVGTSGSSDVRGHGTHVAGIIAAAANTVGGRGVAPEATIVPVKVLNDSGSGTTSGITQGINHVTNAVGTRRADIINMSLGGYVSALDIPYQTAVKNAIARGIVVVAAAGNDATNSRPAPATFPDVICVASTDANNLRSNFSNYGPQITIAAPGTDILSTYVGSNSHYIAISGTSMAAPIVSGAAALYISTLPSKPANRADVVKVKNALVKNGTAAGSPSIGKIVNVGNMFNATELVPKFLVNGGAITDFSKAVPGNATVTITGSGFLVYTTDGSAPAVKDGIVTNGNKYAAAISLSSFAGGKATIKALSVNAQGKIGKVQTLTLTVAAQATTTGLSTITGPMILGAGKSGVYTAKILANAPASAGKTIEWSLSGGAPATIDKKTGKVTVNTVAPINATFTVTARTTGSVPISTTTSNITVRADIIKTLQLNAPANNLHVGGTGGQPATHSFNTVTGHTTTLTNGATLSNLTNYVTWSTSNAKIATVSNAGEVTAVGSGKAKITAKATDGSGKSSTVTVNCVVPATAVTITEATKQLASGCSTTLKAVTVPAKPTTAGVVWSIVLAPAGVTINASGKLSVPASVTTGNITAKATAKSVSGVSNTVTIPIAAAKAASVSITASTNDKNSGRVKLKADGSVSTVNLFTVNPNFITEYDSNGGGTQNSITERTITLTGNAGAGKPVDWKSSNTKVATVTTGGVVTAVAPGKATITCTASDGSGKKATAAITVTIPASSMSVQGKKTLTTYSNPSLAFGKSVQMSAMPGSAHGNVSNKKVKWEYQVFTTNFTTYTRAATYDQYASISQSGKLTIKPAMRNAWNEIPNELTVKVIATALDGSGVTAYQYVDLCPGTEAMAITGGIKNNADGSHYITFRTGVYQGKRYGNYYKDYIVTSTNPNVIAVIDQGSNYVDFFALRKGTATIKIVSNDGTGKATSFTIRVV